MKLSLSIAFTALAAGVSACPRHDSAELAMKKRADGQPKAEWAYEASFNWGRLDPAYALCQTGTQQSPIPLSLSNGLALNHQIDFSYPSEVNGTFFNWGYGPAFTVAREENVWTNNPSITYDNETVYLAGWHIHSPADHSVGGDRSKAEMHFVHVDAEGHEKAVLAFRLDPGNRENAFFSQLPAAIGFNETEKTTDVALNHNLALESVLYFNEFWTYQGSLTSPPCSEGIRWFVARQILFTGVQQMRDILGASTYSARAEQEVWLHRINE